jgi:glycerol-3-phosphate dehydrogenase
VAEISPSDQVDLFIIGGGINGAGIARDAAGRGLRVALAEQGDLAGATSSASSKLVHGGLRYLEQYAFRLVREALAEREVLMRIAPHLVRPLRFVMPHRPGLRPAWMIRIGLFLYDHLGGRSTTLPGSEGISFAAAGMDHRLKPEFSRGFAYSDCRVDDARLVVANARDAAAHGAEILTRTACVAARREGDAWIVTTADQATGTRRSFRAGILVNAAGPWAGIVAQHVAGVAPRRHLRLIKGSHVVVPRLYQGEHAYILQNADGRIVFVIPFEHRFSLIGTTDVAVEGEPGPVDISADEVSYLQRVVATYFERPFETSDIVWSYAGIRPLYDDGKDNPSSVSRDYVLEVDGDRETAPLLSVFGGKITTYRRLAEHAMEQLKPWLAGLKPAWTGDRPLPGGKIGPGGMPAFISTIVSQYPNLPGDLLRGLARRHGSALHEVLGDARTVADLGIDFGGGLYERETAYFVRNEWARTVEDIIWRRSKAGLRLPPGGDAKLAHWLETGGVASGRTPAGTETR